MYKNIAKETKLCLADLVDYSVGQVVSKTLVQNELVSMTIFSFDKGEEIDCRAGRLRQCQQIRNRFPQNHGDVPVRIPQHHLLKKRSLV